MKAIVFDFAGVLFHWQPRRLLQRVLPQRAVDEPSAGHWQAQIFESYGGDWADFDRGTVQPAVLVQRIAERTGLTPAEVQRVVDAVPHALQPQADTVALLKRLHATGHTLFFLSNMPAPYARHLQASHDFLALFSDGVFSCDVGHNKPEPAIYDIAARRFERAPQDLIFIDDHEPNVLQARASGWRSLHFQGAAQAEAGLRREGWTQDFERCPGEQRQP